MDTESDIYFYRARYYNPNSGRFISEDPIGFAGGDVNLYSYVNNNSLILIDSYGMKTSGIGFGGGLAFGGGSVSGDIQIVTDDKGNSGIAIARCVGGLSEAAGVSFDGVGSVGNGETIDDLKGGSSSFNASASIPGVVVSPSSGAAVSFGDSSSGDTCPEKKRGPVTGSVFVGVSAGISFVDLGVSKCKTTILGLD